MRMRTRAARAGARAISHASPLPIPRGGSAALRHTAECGAEHIVPESVLDGFVMRASARADEGARGARERLVLRALSVSALPAVRPLLRTVQHKHDSLARLVSRLAYSVDRQPGASPLECVLRPLVARERAEDLLEALVSGLLAPSVQRAARVARGIEESEESTAPIGTARPMRDAEAVAAHVLALLEERLDLDAPTRAMLGCNVNLALACASLAAGGGSAPRLLGEYVHRAMLAARPEVGLVHPAFDGLVTERDLFRMACALLVEPSALQAGAPDSGRARLLQLVDRAAVHFESARTARALALWTSPRDKKGVDDDSSAALAATATPTDLRELCQVSIQTWQTQSEAFICIATDDITPPAADGNASCAPRIEVHVDGESHDVVTVLLQAAHGGARAFFRARACGALKSASVSRLGRCHVIRLAKSAHATWPVVMQLLPEDEVVLPWRLLRSAVGLLPSAAAAPADAITEAVRQPIGTPRSAPDAVGSGCAVQSPAARKFEQWWRAHGSQKAIATMSGSVSLDAVVIKVWTAVSTSGLSSSAVPALARDAVHVVLATPSGHAPGSWSSGGILTAVRLLVLDEAVGGRAMRPRLTQTKDQAALCVSQDEVPLLFDGATHELGDPGAVSRAIEELVALCDASLEASDLAEAVRAAHVRGRVAESALTSGEHAAQLVGSPRCELAHAAIMQVRAPSSRSHVHAAHVRDVPRWHSPRMPRSDLPHPAYVFGLTATAPLPTTGLPTDLADRMQRDPRQAHGRTPQRDAAGQKGRGEAAQHDAHLRTHGDCQQCGAAQRPLASGRGIGGEHGGWRRASLREHRSRRSNGDRHACRW